MNHPGNTALRGHPVRTTADLGRLPRVNFDPMLWLSAQPGLSRHIAGELGALMRRRYVVPNEVLAECERQTQYTAISGQMSLSDGASVVTE